MGKTVTVQETGFVTLPMFPLGTVLLPGMVLPLHVFEERYRQLVQDVLHAGRPEFGVALIERGSEVGGGDLRAWTGCAADIVEAARTEDGRWALVCVGTRRLRVLRWLPDEPYPVAEVEDWPDEDPSVSSPDVGERLDRLEQRVRRLGMVSAELGGPDLPRDVAYSDEPEMRSFQLGVTAPLGALDRKRVLDAPGTTDRVALLEELLAEQELLVEGRLALGGRDGTPPGGGDGTAEEPTD